MEYLKEKPEILKNYGIVIYDFKISYPS